MKVWLPFVIEPVGAGVVVVFTEPFIETEPLTLMPMDW